MAILILGLALFIGVHSLRMAVPTARENLLSRFGEGPYKGVYSLVSIVGFVLIIVGFSMASSDSGMLYEPPFGLRRVTEAAMLPALILAIASALPPGHISRFVRNPLTVGTLLWSAAHLIVNGETAAVILFGAFLLWSAALLVSAMRRPAAPRKAPSAAMDAAAIVAGVVVYGAFVWRLHEWLFGVSPVA